MASAVQTLDISPVGRVEGDLDVRVDIQDGVIVNAWTQAELFRGFEVILRDKDPQAGLVVTPRACGICGASHLTCAAWALDTAWQTEVPRNAILARNLGQIVESLQSLAGQPVIPGHRVRDQALHPRIVDVLQLLPEGRVHVSVVRAQACRTPADLKNAREERIARSEGSSFGKRKRAEIRLQAFEMQGLVCGFYFKLKITPGTKPERREDAALSPIGKKFIELPQHQAISHLVPVAAVMVGVV